MISPRSSLLGLIAMMLLLVVLTLGAMIVLSDSVIYRHFNLLGRNQLLDDLGEYEVIYRNGGPQVLKTLYAAGTHDKDQLMRLVDRHGETVMEHIPDSFSHLSWSMLAPPEVPASGTAWSEVHLQADQKVMLAGKRLHDGSGLWFGRINIADRAAISQMHHTLMLAAGVALVLAVGPVVWFANRVLQPVQKLAQTARQLAQGTSMQTRLPAASTAIPELRDFAAAFNQTLDRVEQVTHELEAANDQLAHELRTPLARVRGNIEAVLRSHQNAADPSDAAVAALDEIDRASRLIQSILSIRSGDARTMRLQLEMRSIVEIVTQVGELYSAAAEEKDIDLELTITGDDLLMLLDRERVQQAVSNLLDNALAYTPAGGKVVLAVETYPDSVIVCVRDSGPGLSDSDPDRIWRRFVRGSAASAKVPGIGLGLSLVKAITHAHRGKVDCRNLPEGGAEFRIMLPVSR